MKKALLFGLILAVCSTASAHLCNDVFQQAKDNLAVKVDIRDGQLRIGQEASFRVYLLNTMDRDIVCIALEVKSNDFEAKIVPSPTWKRHPYLATTVRGGQKEYFEVTLKRKAGVPDGKYKIDLRLYAPADQRAAKSGFRNDNPNDPGTDFKTIDLEAAAGIVDVPQSKDIKIDGDSGREEWEKGALCTDFQIYKSVGNYFENRAAQEQSRVRVSVDDKNLYCLFSLQGGDKATADTAKIHVATAADGEPIIIELDRVAGKVSGTKGTDGIEVKASKDRQNIEAKIPRALLGIDKAGTFYLNFTRHLTRDGKEEVSYWRGNKFSVGQPMVFGQFRVTE